ncbi:MAG TPA: hypothetical protein VL137_17295, partial [Polyangiaceae bacterium]|nr:hypothetical protein [Polyangiaceae bacterium]
MSKRIWESVWPPLLIAAAIVCAYRTSLTFQLIGDAEFLIKDNRQMDSIGNWWTVVSSDYFDATHGEHIGYWRPLTKLSWLLETVLGAHNSAVYQAVQIAWLVVGALGILRLSTLLGSPRSLGLVGALLFGLHPALIEPACLVMARSDLVCGACVIWSLAGWWSWRKGLSRWPILHSAAAAGALLSKETGVILPVVLLAWELSGTEPMRRRLSAAYRYLLPAVSLLGVYLLLRAQVLGSVASVAINLSPSRLLALCGAYAQGLLPLPLESTVRNMSYAEAKSVWSILRGSIALATAVGALELSRRYFRVGIGLLAWAAGSLALVVLPAQMHVPGGATQIVAADRWLLHAVAAVAVALPLLAERYLSLRGRLAAWVVTGGWTILAVATGPVVHAPYTDGISLLDLDDQAFLATPERFRTAEQACHFLERDLLRKRLAGDLPSALQLLHDMERSQCIVSNARLSLLQPLLQAGNFADARQIADAELQHGIVGRHLNALPFIGWALLESGDPSRAAQVLQKSLDLQPNQCAVQFRLAQARATLGNAGEAARLFQSAFHCAGQNADPRWLIASAELALRANDRSLLQQIRQDLQATPLP